MDGQSEEGREAPATSSGSGSQQLKESQDSGAETSAGDQVDRRSNKNSDRSQGQRRGRFLGRFRKRRATDSAEQANVTTEQSATKPKIGLVGVVITALVGFFFGVASNQVSDYVKQAGDCSDALTQYSVNTASNFVGLWSEMHEPAATIGQKNDAGSKYNNLMNLVANKVRNKCPIEGENQYLAEVTIHKLTDNIGNMERCLPADAACSGDDAERYQTDASNSAIELAYDAGVVSQWGLLRRAKYVVLHIY